MRRLLGLPRLRRWQRVQHEHNFLLEDDDAPGRAKTQARPWGDPAVGTRGCPRPVTPIADETRMASLTGVVGRGLPRNGSGEGSPRAAPRRAAAPGTLRRGSAWRAAAVVGSACPGRERRASGGR